MAYKITDKDKDRSRQPLIFTINRIVAIAHAYDEAFFFFILCPWEYLQSKKKKWKNHNSIENIKRTNTLRSRADSVGSDYYYKIILGLGSFADIPFHLAIEYRFF